MIAMPGEKSNPPGNWRHYNLSTKGQKALSDFNLDKSGNDAPVSGSET
jgi:hypothetical protein